MCHDAPGSVVTPCSFDPPTHRMPPTMIAAPEPLARCLAFEAHAPPVSPSAAVLTANTMQQDEKVKKAFFHCAPQQVAIADTAYSQDNAAADLYLPIHSSICSLVIFSPKFAVRDCNSCFEMLPS